MTPSLSKQDSLEAQAAVAEAPRSKRTGKKRPSRPEGGFTLVELMVAVFLLSIGLLGIAQVFAISNRHTANSRRETVANSLAQEIREKIMSETFGDVESIFDNVDTDNEGMIPDPARDWADHVANRLGIGARGRVVVLNPTERASLQDGMLAVVITISWNESGTLIDMPLEFLLARIGA